MRTIKGVSAGLDLIAERKKKHRELGQYLDFLDEIDSVVGSDNGETNNSAPIRRPYSGDELRTTERWK